MYLARERAPRVLRHVSRGWIVAIAVCLVAAGSAGIAAAGSGAALCGPSLTYQSHQTQDGITEATVSYASGGSTVQGYLYLPAGTGQCSGVLFNHDGGNGVNADVRRRARDLASLGFIVFAPAYRSGTGTQRDCVGLGETVCGGAPCGIPAGPRDADLVGSARWRGAHGRSE